jgi:hypothetical protein
LIKQALVVVLSLLPFGLSIMAAYITWRIFPFIEGWHMVVTASVWIAVFAGGTQLFWRIVEQLAPKQ